MISFKGILHTQITQLAKNKEELNNSSFKSVNTLERSPKSDSVEFKTTQKSQNVSKAKSKENLAFKETKEKLELVKDSKLFTDEVLMLLEPGIDSTKSNEFSAIQTKIINAAAKKVTFFKNLSKELETEASIYGELAHARLQEIFGGDEGFGQNIKFRQKEAPSIYDKLVKEYKNNYIKNNVHDIFAQKAFNKPYSLLDKDEKKLIKMGIKDGDIKAEKKDYQAILKALEPNVDNYLAKKLYKKSYDNLTRTEKTEIRKQKALKQNSSMKIEKEEATNWIRDLVGARLVLPIGNRVNMKKVEKYLDKAFEKNQLRLTRISNYRSNSVLPYLDQDTARRWKDSIPGVELVTSSVKKSNGYTTTQMNFEFDFPGKETPLLLEFQIRSEEMNYINDVEHYIYDVLENKDITKGIPELKQFFEASGFEKAVKEVFGSNATVPGSTRTKEQNYMDYEHAMFAYIRDSETPSYKFGKMFKPILADFGLGEYESVLSFDALNSMNEKVQIIKEKYGNKEIKTKHK